MSVWSRFFKRELSCDQVAAVLQQYLDQELDVAQVPEVLRHLEACKDCGLEASIYARIKTSLHALQEAPDPTSLARVRALATDLAASGAADPE